MTPNMKIIENGLDHLVEAFPELAPHAANALSAIKASWERAGLPEKRLANAARHNIASYVMAFVAAAYDTGKVSGGIVSHLRSLMDHAMSIEAKPADRHQPIGHAPREPWRGKEGGPWKRAAGEGHELTLVNIPNMPGGQWTISIRGVPCLYGTDPEEVEDRTVELLALVDAARRAPPAATRPILWN